MGQVTVFAETLRTTQQRWLSRFLKPYEVPVEGTGVWSQPLDVDVAGAFDAVIIQMPDYVLAADIQVFKDRYLRKGVPPHHDRTWDAELRMMARCRVVRPRRIHGPNYIEQEKIHAIYQHMRMLERPFELMSTRYSDGWRHHQGEITEGIVVFSFTRHG